MNNASMTQLLGQDVIAYGDTFEYDEKDKTLLQASSDVSNATLTVPTSPEASSGQAISVLWKPAKASMFGMVLRFHPGRLKRCIASIEGYDSDGDNVSVTELIHGEVDGISFDSGTPVPSVDGVDVDLGDILEVMGASRDDEESDDMSIKVGFNDLIGSGQNKSRTQSPGKAWC